MAETVAIKQEVVSQLAAEMGDLIDELEMLAEGTTEKALQRLKEIKVGKAKTYSEAEFKALLKKEGVDV